MADQVTQDENGDIQLNVSPEQLLRAVRIQRTMLIERVETLEIAYVGLLNERNALIEQLEKADAAKAEAASA